MLLRNSDVITPALFSLLGGAIAARGAPIVGGPRGAPVGLGARGGALGRGSLSRGGVQSRQPQALPLATEQTYGTSYEETDYVCTLIM